MRPRPDIEDSRTLRREANVLLEYSAGLRATSKTLLARLALVRRRYEESGVRVEDVESQLPAPLEQPRDGGL